MDFRADFIKNEDNGLVALFEQYKNDRQPDDPIEIETIGVGLNDPAKLNELQLPAVFFHYGATRRLDTETVGSERESFTVIIEATVNKIKATNPDDSKDFIQRSGEMRLLIDQIAQESRAGCTSDEIVLENVFVASATPYTDALNKFVFIVFELTYIYEFRY